MQDLYNEYGDDGLVFEVLLVDECDDKNYINLLESFIEEDHPITINKESRTRVYQEDLGTKITPQQRGYRENPNYIKQYYKKNRGVMLKRQNEYERNKRDRNKIIT